MIKTGYDHILRQMITGIDQRGCRGQCHNIICADDRIRKVFPRGNQTVHDLDGFQIAPVAIADILRRQCKAVLFHYPAGDLKAFVTVDVIVGPSHEKNPFYIMFFQQMRDQFTHAVFITDTDRRDPFIIHSDTDHRDMLLFCFTADVFRCRRGIEHGGHHDDAVVLLHIRQLVQIQLPLIDGLIGAVRGIA